MSGTCLEADVKLEAGSSQHNRYEKTIQSVEMVIDYRRRLPGHRTVFWTREDQPGQRSNPVH